MNAPNDHLLLFHLGPVQGFIAEARRTRDLWTGSFILSWLSGLAMKTVKDAHGKIIAPDVSGDLLFKAISSGEPCEYLPSLPNHFKALVPENFDPDTCRAAIHEGWARIANAVFTEIVKPCLPAGADPARWYAQVNAVGKSHPLWDIYWVKGPKTELDEIDGALERRKVWRNLQPVETSGGDFCTMMPRFRELSGIAGASKAGSSRKRAFWESFRDNVSKTLKEGHDGDAELLEIRPGEHLSPIALVKRLMPRLKAGTLEGLFGWLPPSHTTNRMASGTDLERLMASYRPSTAALAITHWLARANKLAPEAIEAFRKAVVDATFKPMQIAERFRVCSALDGVNAASLDGKLFNDGYLELAVSRFNDPNAEREPGFRNDKWLQSALSRLRELYAAENADRTETVGRPSNYYAILKADGDNAGKILSDGTREEPFIKALAAFSQEMSALVPKHNGELIYAGGDDLLALLPIEDALPAAMAVQASYAKAVSRYPALATAPPTISVAVLFVKANVALGSALETAGHLLDHVAKAGNGRDSLAIRILRGGGEGATWVSRWSTARSAVQTFAEIATDRSLHRFGSNRFVYGINAMLPGLLVDRRQSGSGNEDHSSTKTPPKALGFCDISDDVGYSQFEKLVRGVVAKDREAEASKLDLSRLKPLIRRTWADSTGKEYFSPDPSLDGLMILKFLCKEWRKFDAPPSGAAQIPMEAAAP